MNEIPEDIEARLTAAVSEFFARKFGGEYEGDVFIDLLRDAILAEREQCAKIAEEAGHWEVDNITCAGSYTTDTVASSRAVWKGLDGPSIAAAIRQGQAKEGEGK